MYGWTYGDGGDLPVLDAGAGGLAGSSGAAGGAAAGGASGASGTGGTSGGGGIGSGNGGTSSVEPGALAYLNVEPRLVDADATDNARRLMHYLTDSYGERVLSGQQGPEYIADVLAITGEEPAVLGLDLIDYSPSRVERGATSIAAEQAIEWWQRGGIVTVAWHWNAPSGLIDQPGFEWWRGFYTNATTFDVAAAMSDPSSAAYQELVRDIDAIAVPLRQLADADVPVLFRPLHEASGGWFWWGARGAAPYLALWDLVYTRLTVEHGLHNLIWVWNGQAAGFYPGDHKVDIVSEDIYATRRSYGAQHARFLDATRYPDTPKLVALSENGALVDPIELIASRTAWSWFCLWSGDEFVVDETWNEDSMKRAVYAHEYVTTLSELPDLASYPLP